MDIHEKKLKKKKFAIGIFLMLLVIESVLAAAAALIYFRHSTMKGIEKIEKYTKNYSFTLADAFADVAALSYRANDYTTLKDLFHQEIRENTIDEAFFALNDGRLIAHSSRDKEKELAGNIATDEFAYNIDLILRPSLRNLTTIQFTSYNVMGKTVPFPREYRELMKRYLYDEVDLLGWLVSKAVYNRKTAVGTVNFIIYKDRIYRFIDEQFNEARRFYLIAQGIAVALSFLISIVVVLRYRSIQKKTYDLARGMKSAGKRGLPEIIEIVPGREITVAQLEDRDDGLITLSLHDDMPDEKLQIEVVDNDNLDDPEDHREMMLPPAEAITAMLHQEAADSPGGDDDRLINTRQVVQDAIPIDKKRH